MTVRRYLPLLLFGMSGMLGLARGVAIPKAPPSCAHHLPPARGPVRVVKINELLLARLNLYRAQHGLSALTYSETAAKAARMQALYNLTHFTHGHANDQYPESKDRLKAAGHRYEPCLYYTEYNREVCVRLQKTSARYIPVLDSLIMRSYRESAAHDEALLDPTVRRVGIATLWDGWEVQNTMILCI